MITWVNATLIGWGSWVQTDRGMGSKGLSAKWGEPGGGSCAVAHVPRIHLEHSRTDAWVRALPRADLELLVEHYCTPRTSAQHALKLQMSLRTLYTRLHALHCRYAEHQAAREAATVPRRK